MKYAISRSINGISLNGQEFALNEKGDVMTFDSKALAKAFAGKLATGKESGDVDLGKFGLNICRIDDDGSYELL